jgi:hypothetical protein
VKGSSFQFSSEINFNFHTRQAGKPPDTPIISIFTGSKAHPLCQYSLGIRAAGQLPLEVANMKHESQYGTMNWNKNGKNLYVVNRGHCQAQF